MRSILGIRLPIVDESQDSVSTLCDGREPKWARVSLPDRGGCWVGMVTRSWMFGNLFEIASYAFSNTYPSPEPTATRREAAT